MRLVTLTGPGGTGKTRLALQAAAEVAEDYPDGTWWLPLAPLRDAQLVPLSIAEVLQLRDEPGLSIGARLAAGLIGKRLLLLLDNAEHLLPSIVETIAQLRAIEGPLLLITSRERLQLQGEHLFPVPAMDKSDGVDLFVERARQVDPGFEDTAGVAALCERLDRLPLALELAAARTSIYTPAQLLERLGDRLDLLRAGRDSDPRQQTLRATIDWSFELLTPEEQRVYRAFSVFAGGCTLEAAEEVCGAVPDTLASLLDKSLLRRREGVSGRRYWMLETIREHAAEHLARLGERESLETSQADLYVDLADRRGGSSRRSASTRRSGSTGFSTSGTTCVRPSLITVTEGTRENWLACAPRSGSSGSSAATPARGDSGCRRRSTRARPTSCCPGSRTRSPRSS
jgi:predicted ATPase